MPSTPSARLGLTGPLLSETADGPDAFATLIGQMETRVAATLAAGRPAAGAWNLTGTPSLAANSNDPLPLTVDGAIAPTSGAFTLAGDTKTVTCVAAGWYVVNGWVQVNAPSSQGCFGDLRSPSVGVTFALAGGPASTLHRFSLAAGVYLPASSTLQLRAFCPVSGGTAAGGRLSIIRLP